jgi:hypothetical protein
LSFPEAFKGPFGRPLDMAQKKPATRKDIKDWKCATTKHLIVCLLFGIDVWVEL